MPLRRNFPVWQAITNKPNQIPTFDLDFVFLRIVMSCQHYPPQAAITIAGRPGSRFVARFALRPGCWSGKNTQKQRRRG